MKTVLYNYMRVYVYTIFFCLMLVADPKHGNAESPKPVDVQPGQESTPFVFPIQVFRSLISGADGDRCVMHPSCSQYALDAIRKHGSIIGWVMTCDRLMRCGMDETRHTPPVRVGRRILSYDPVENNDFWRK